MSEKIDPGEWREFLKKLFPPQILGQVRPTEPIPSSLDFSIEFPQWMRKDPAFYMQLNAAFAQAFSNDATLDNRIEQGVIASQTEPTVQREGGIWLEILGEGTGSEGGGGDETSSADMVVSNTPPASMTAVWGDTKNDGTGKQAVDGGDLQIAMVVSETPPLDKNKLWGYLHPDEKES